MNSRKLLFVVGALAAIALVFLFVLFSAGTPKEAVPPAEYAAPNN